VGSTDIRTDSIKVINYQSRQFQLGEGKALRVEQLRVFQYRTVGVSQKGAASSGRHPAKVFPGSKEIF
jgi:hypothetical protein